MSGTSSTTPPLYGVDTSLTPEQRKAYEEIGAALAVGDREPNRCRDCGHTIIPRRLYCMLCVHNHLPL